MDNETVRNRTLRRRQKTEIINDLAQDLDTVDKLRVAAITPKEVIAYDTLYELIYANYVAVLSSEV